jgi:protein required for attachment to host cells
MREKSMDSVVVAVLSHTKARLLTLEPSEFPDYESSPNLVEQESLLSATSELQGAELWSNLKAGRNRGAAGQAHSYDDHRDNHRVEFERRFAQAIAQKLITLIQTCQAQKLILIAEPQVLGLMRDELAASLPTTLKLNELAKDLCQLSNRELQDYLATKELLPARRMPL